MKISKTGLDLIKKFEGCVLTGYKDVVGVPTVGWGHTGGVVVGQKISQARADELLIQDLERFEDGVNELVNVPLNQNQFDSLVSFCFNLGNATLANSTLLKKLNAKDYVGAAKEFDRFIYAGGEVYQGLVNRRNAEQALFSKAVPTKPVISKPKAPSSSAVVPYPNHVLKKGSTDHDNVKRVQRALGIQADGIFGNGTHMAVRNYQARHNLTVDGIIGKNTWNTLF